MEVSRAYEAEYNEALNIVTVQASNMRAILDSALDFTKIESGGMQLVLSEFDLSVFLEDLRFLQSRHPKCATLSWSVGLAKHLPVTMISADRRLLFQVLVNLISNAFKFTETGSITLIVSDGTLPRTPRWPNSHFVNSAPPVTEAIEELNIINRLRPQTSTIKNPVLAGHLATYSERVLRYPMDPLITLWTPLWTLWTPSLVTKVRGDGYWKRSQHPELVLPVQAL